MKVARVLVGVIQIIHYPVNHAPARASTRDLLAQLSGRELGGAAFNAAEVLTFFASTLALSLVRRAAPQPSSHPCAGRGCVLCLCEWAG
jgi:hypothetical protein